jgi:hypothetical protein
MEAAVTRVGGASSGVASRVREPSGKRRNAAVTGGAASSCGDLTQVGIENLMNMEVTSVSKKKQKLSAHAKLTWRF